MLQTSQDEGSIQKAQSTGTGEAQFGLLLTVQKEALAAPLSRLRRRQLVHTLAEGQATRAATEIRQCEPCAARDAAADQASLQPWLK